MMSNPVIARIAHVVDEYRVVINRGSEAGVKLGDRYLVFGLGADIVDPESNESLGQLELVRGRAEVVHLQEKMATLESIETFTTPGKKRVVKRNSLNALMGYGNEEITEGAETHQDTLKDPAKGDFARPI